MRGDQRGVQINRQPLRRAGQFPDTRTRPSVRITQSIEQARCARNPIDHPKRGRRRRGRPEQHGLITDRTQVRQAVTAVSEHHRQITDHPAAVMAAGPQPGLTDRDVQRPRQPGLISDLSQQGAAGTRHQPVSVRPHVYRDLAPSVRHLQGDPPESALRASATRTMPAQADSQAAPTTGAAPVS